MKKISIIAIILCFALVAFYFVREMYKVDGYFSVEEYQSDIEANLCNETLGPIQNAAVARIKAERVLKKFRKKFGIKLFSKSIVEYDPENEVWMVIRRFDHVVYAGFALVIFQENDGKVLALTGMG